MGHINAIFEAVSTCCPPIIACPQTPLCPHLPWLQHSAHVVSSLDAKHADCVGSVGLKSNSRHCKATSLALNAQCSPTAVLYLSNTQLLDCTIVCVFLACSWLAAPKSNHMGGIAWAARSNLLLVLKVRHSSHGRQLCKMPNSNNVALLLSIF